jgi:hypothetical protein
MMEMTRGLCLGTELGEQPSGAVPRAPLLSRTPSRPTGAARDDDSDAEELPPPIVEPEDVPGVPTRAWCRVRRGVPLSDPYVPGEGAVLLIDAARFLPGTLSVPRARLPRAAILY